MPECYLRVPKWASGGDWLSPARSPRRAARKYVVAASWCVSIVRTYGRIRRRTHSPLFAPFVRSAPLLRTLTRAHWATPNPTRARISTCLPVLPSITVTTTAAIPATICIADADRQHQTHRTPAMTFAHRRSDRTSPLRRCTLWVRRALLPVARLSAPFAPRLLFLFFCLDIYLK